MPGGLQCHNIYNIALEPSRQADWTPPPLLGQKVGIICSGRYRVSWKRLSATPRLPWGVRPLPRHMVLLQHIMIVRRLLLSSFLARFRVPGLIPCQHPVICNRKREGSQTGSKNVKSQWFSFPTTAWHRLEEERWW